MSQGALDFGGPRIKLRTARESVGWLNSVGPLVVSPFADPRVNPAELPRLTHQNGRILDKLLEGPVSNAWLSTVALKYTSRVSDIRKHVRRYGYDVEAFGRDHETGACWYRLVRRG